MAQPVLEITDLTRRFGTTLANDHIGLRVDPGEVVGLLGHNGAGKTTLVSQVVGLLRPDSGRIQVAGIDAVARPGLARRCTALQAQAQAPLEGLTPQAAIEIAGRIRGLSKPQARTAAQELAGRLDILRWFTTRAMPDGAGLSGGVRRLTAFAMAVVGEAPLIILDEPTNDVDAARRRRLWETVRHVADNGAGVLLVTHNVAEAERVVDELVILDRGRAVASGSPSSLRAQHDADLRLELASSPEQTTLPGTAPFPISRRTQAGRRILLSVSTDDASKAVAWANQLQESGVIEGYSLTPLTLEDSYLAATSETPPSAASGYTSDCGQEEALHA